jgi:hypothetical protein
MNGELKVIWKEALEEQWRYCSDIYQDGLRKGESQSEQAVFVHDSIQLHPEYQSKVLPLRRHTP